MSESRRLRAVFAAMATVLAVTLAPLPGLANQDGGNDNNEQQRDTQSRNEAAPPTDHIMVRFGDGGLFDVKYIILIQTRFIHVTDTFSRSIGVDYRNLNRADISDVPLIGGFFEEVLSADDLTEENRVGSVYRGAEGTLVAVLDDAVNLADSEVSVVNGNGRYVITKPPEMTQVAPSQLGEIGGLESVQTLVRGNATRSTSLVLGGLTKTSQPATDDNIPVLSDIPVLRSNFLGDAFEVDDSELVILIKPSIVTRDKDTD